MTEIDCTNIAIIKILQCNHFKRKINDLKSNNLRVVATSKLFGLRLLLSIKMALFVSRRSVKIRHGLRDILINYLVTAIARDFYFVRNT